MLSLQPATFRVDHGDGVGSRGLGVVARGRHDGGDRGADQEESCCRYEQPPAARATLAREPLEGSRPPGCVECGVLREDRRLELDQLAPGLHSKLLLHRASRAGVAIERVRLAAAAIEREHQLGLQTLAEWVVRDQRLELARYGAVMAERQLGVHAVLDGAEIDLLEPRDLGLGKCFVGEVGQRGAAPNRERLAEHPLRASGVAVS